jgi:hypothetical protein
MRSRDQQLVTLGRSGTTSHAGTLVASWSLIPILSLSRDDSLLHWAYKFSVLASLVVALTLRYT